jgi:hypothetical protein
MQDPTDMVHHYVKVIREADAALSWTPYLREDDPSWTPAKVQRFHDRYRRRRDTSSFRLRRLLPGIEDDSIPRGLAHEDPEVRRIFLKELTRRHAGVSMADGSVSSTGVDDALHIVGQARDIEAGR